MTTLCPTVAAIKNPGSDRSIGGVDHFWQAHFFKQLFENYLKKLFENYLNFFFLKICSFFLTEELFDHL